MARNYWNKINRATEAAVRDMTTENGGRAWGSDGRLHEIGDKVGKNGEVVTAAEQAQREKAEAAVARARGAVDQQPSSDLWRQQGHTVDVNHVHERGM